MDYLDLQTKNEEIKMELCSQCGDMTLMDFGNGVKRCIGKCAVDLKVDLENKDSDLLERGVEDDD